MKHATTTAPGEMPARHALIVDDDEGMRRTVVVLLRSRNIRSTTAANGAEAIERLSNARFDVVLTDLHMPKVNGLELLEWIQENQPEVPVVLMTGVLTAAVSRAAVDGGVATVLQKPFGPADFFPVLKQVLARFEVLPLPVSS